MNRRRTLSEMRWPEDAADADLPVEWAESVAIQVLDWVWRGYDGLLTKIGGVDLSELPEQLERNLTKLHFGEIQLLWHRETDGYPSIQPGHEMPELLSRASASAKPPAYDLSFAHVEHDLWQWPIEAKVVPTPFALAEYLKDVQDKFVVGIAAPIVGQGGMIAYLLNGGEREFFVTLASQIKQPLKTVPNFSDRPHCTSRHLRSLKPDLRLHHMAMRLMKE